MNSFVEYENCVMLLAPADIASTETASAYMRLQYAQKAGILVIFGAITSATPGDHETLTLEVATAEDGAETAIAYRYRKAGALGVNTWGAVTAVGATGVDLGNDEDNIMVWIEVDPDVLGASDYTVARVRVDDVDDMAACLVTVLGFTEPRYKQTTHTSVTASASA